MHSGCDQASRILEMLHIGNKILEDICTSHDIGASATIHK